MEEEFRAILAADIGVAAITGAISWGGFDQSVTGPRVALWAVAGSRGILLNAQSGLLEAIVQADCYAEDYSTAKALARAVANVLAGYSGGKFQAIFHASSRDLSPGADAGAATRPYRISLDFNITYSG